MVTIDIKTGETVQSGLTLEERVKQLEERLDQLIRVQYVTVPSHTTIPTTWPINPPTPYWETTCGVVQEFSTLAATLSGTAH